MLTALVMVGDAGPERAAAAPRYRVRTQPVAPGLLLHRIRDSRGPKAIRVLEMAPRTQLALDAALARGRIPRHEKTSSMAARRNAVAAINGDYTLGKSHEWSGRPVHAFAHDARMVTTELSWGRNVGIGEDKRIAALGRARMNGFLTHPAKEEPWRINRWNDVLWGKQTVAYTPEGGGAFKPPPDACSVRVFPQGDPLWTADGLGVEQEHVVDRAICRDERLGRAGGTVISIAYGTNKAAEFVADIMPGDVVTVGWSLGWDGVVETIGGNPMLIENGELVAQCRGSSFCNRHPRTGVGTRPDGTILLVTVDGRRKNSVGIKPMAFAKLFRWLDADWALNLDGGGSTTMWVRGEIVNVPSTNGMERGVGSALLVLPHPDPSEPVVRSPQGSSDSGGLGLDPLLDREAPGTARGAPSLDVDAATTCAALRDPASTGGLFDALARGSFGGGPGGVGRVPARLPGRLSDALQVFRGRTSCSAYLGR